MLEAAAINPHDGEAQYQLGLIHQQRRQYTEAIRRFEAAVAIDNTETDAHFQLAPHLPRPGPPRRRPPPPPDRAGQDEKHSFSEVHRELGAIYLALGRVDDAARHLAIYTDRREYDPEGLYLYGQVLERQGHPARPASFISAPWRPPGPRPVTAAASSPDGAGWPRKAGPARHSVIPAAHRGAALPPAATMKTHVPGVYVSYPFCAQKCTYCNFASGVFPRDLEARYLDALRREISAYTWQWTPETVYLGGGTPSTLDPAALADAPRRSIPGRPWRKPPSKPRPAPSPATAPAPGPAAGINRV